GVTRRPGRVHLQLGSPGDHAPATPVVRAHGRRLSRVVVAARGHFPVGRRRKGTDRELAPPRTDASRLHVPRTVPASRHIPTDRGALRQLAVPLRLILAVVVRIAARTNASPSLDAAPSALSQVSGRS